MKSDHKLAGLVLLFHILCGVYVRTQAWGAFSLSSTLSLNMYFLINIHPSLFSTEFPILASQLQLLGSYSLPIKPHPTASWLLPVLLLKEIVLLPKSIYEDISETIKQMKLIKLSILSNFSALKSWSALGTLVSVMWFMWTDLCFELWIIVQVTC